MSWAGGVQAGQLNPGRVPASFERLEQWLTAVRRHEPGTLDAAAREIAGWPDEHLIRVVVDVGELSRFLARARVRLERTGVLTATNYGGRTVSLAEVLELFGLTKDEARTADVGRLVMRAALLHTDITVHLDEYDPLTRPRSPRSPRMALLIADGRQEGIADTGPHWVLARALLDLLPPDSPRAAQKRQWYVATAAFMHSRVHLAPLLPHLDHARRLLPTDAEILFYSGSLHETLAAPTIQQAIRAITESAQFKVAVGDARTHLEQARAFFRQALDYDPAHVEARLRLGRVLGALGRDEEAASELPKALAAATSPRLEYYAALFLGGTQARLGRADAARASFERAATLYPKAQSPRLALSSLARAAGDRSSATRILMKALPPKHEDDFMDPWWMYFGTPMDRADDLLFEWRRSVTNSTTP